MANDETLMTIVGCNQRVQTQKLDFEVRELGSDMERPYVQLRTTLVGIFFLAGRLVYSEKPHYTSAGVANFLLF